MTEHETASIILGELLVAAGLISCQEVDGLSTLAQFMGLPLGNLLVREKKVSRELLKVAIRLQTLIADGKISVELSCRAIRDIVRGTVLAEQMLESVSAYAENVRDCRLGELLVDAGLLSDLALGRALVESTELKAPLGQTLVQQGALTDEIVAMALSIQSRVRACIIDYKAAVIQLKDVKYIGRMPHLLQAS